MQKIEQNPKIIINAISAYLLVLVSSSFLFIKENKLINNDFVKNHTKSALILHILLIINYAVFIHFGFLDILSFFEIGVHIIVADILFFVLGIFMVIGIYKAQKGEYFRLGNIIKAKNRNFLDITKDGNFGEKDKLTIIFSYIPFIGYIIGGKYENNPEIKNILRFNLFISSIITIIFLLGYRELTNLFSLFYIVFIAFIGVNLFAKEELINIKLPEYFSPSENIKYIKSCFIYLKKYLSGNFEKFDSIKKNIDEKYELLKAKETEKLHQLQEIHIPKKIIYIPIIGLISIFSKNTKQKYHIRNSIILNILLLLCFILVLFNYLSIKIFILFLFPICFGIGKIHKNYYKQAYTYDIYNFFSFLKNSFKKSKNTIKEKRNEVKEVNFKVEKEKKED